MAKGSATAGSKARFHGADTRSTAFDDERSGPNCGASAGSGWHASTWDLRHGLVVLEGLPDDALPDERLNAYLMTQGAGV